MKHSIQAGRADGRIGSNRRARCARAGFTLVEMLVSMALLAMIAAVLATVLTLLSNAQRYVSGQTSSFEDASLAFQSMSRTLSQASLETYFDYYPPQNGSAYTKPTAFIRQSNLHFICDQAINLIPGGSQAINPTHAVFFQSLLGYSQANTSGVGQEYAAIPDLLNACGYYISFYNNAASIPGISTLSSNATYRYRLMELMQPTEEMGVYGDSGTSEPYTWISTPINNGEVRALADNIIALVIEPQYSEIDQAAMGSTQLTTNYAYDSRQGASNPPPQPVNANQLPSVIRITMVAIDEASAIGLARQNGTNPPALVDSNLFTSTNPGQYDADIATLSAKLTGLKPRVNYRIFTATIPMRSSKWSSQSQ